jgi:protein TonB
MFKAVIDYNIRVTQILLFLLLTGCLQVIAQDGEQKFTLTHSGAEPITLKLHGLGAQEIHTRALKWFQTIYQDTNKPAISVEKNKSISVNGSIEKAFVMDENGLPFVFDIEYVLQIEVNDGVARLAIDVGQIWWHHFSRKAEFTYQRFFTQDGQIKKSYANSKNQLEKSINVLVREFDQDLKMGATNRMRQTNDTSRVFVSVDKNAEPRGGFPAFYKFLEDNVQYPEQARRSAVSGKVIFKFVVEPDGLLTNMEIVESLFKDCDNELIRVLRLCPNWIPGELMGKKVRQAYTMPFNFKLQ